MQRSRECLFSPAGERARQYLNDRGLNDAVLRAGRVGFNLETARSRWGSIEVYLPRVIVLPSWFDGAFTRVKFGTATGNYLQATGGMDSLYIPFKMPTPDCLIVLCESEIDALSIPPGAPVVPVALGGSEGLPVGAMDHPPGPGPAGLAGLRQ